MIHVPMPGDAAMAKLRPGDAWRTRTLLVMIVMAAALIGVSAIGLDWSEGLAMALGQIAGIVMVPAVFGVSFWAIAALIGRRR